MGPPREGEGSVADGRRGRPAPAWRAREQTRRVRRSARRRGSLAADRWPEVFARPAQPYPSPRTRARLPARPARAPYPAPRDAKCTAKSNENPDDNGAELGDNPGCRRPCRLQDEGGSGRSASSRRDRWRSRAGERRDRPETSQRSRELLVIVPAELEVVELAVVLALGQHYSSTEKVDFSLPQLYAVRRKSGRAAGQLEAIVAGYHHVTLAAGLLFFLGLRGPGDEEGRHQHQEREQDKAYAKKH